MPRNKGTANGERARATVATFRHQIQSVFDQGYALGRRGDRRLGTHDPEAVGYFACRADACMLDRGGSTDLVGLACNAVDKIQEEQSNTPLPPMAITPALEAYIKSSRAAMREFIGKSTIDLLSEVSAMSMLPANADCLASLIAGEGKGDASASVEF